MKEGLIMSEILNVKFLISILLFLTYPLQSAYLKALREANLQTKEHILLGLISTTAVILALNLGFILIGQIDEKTFSLFNLVFVFFSFAIARIIHRKMPSLFLKKFFTQKGGPLS
jgi:hypothetical protein